MLRSDIVPNGYAFTRYTVSPSRYTGRLSEGRSTRVADASFPVRDRRRDTSWRGERERERERREDRESIRKIKRATAKEKSSIADRDIDIADENGPPLSQHVNVISIQHADRHAVYLATRTLSH